LRTCHHLQHCWILQAACLHLHTTQQVRVLRPDAKLDSNYSMLVADSLLLLSCQLCQLS
jgi:hypothetical protein